MCLLVSSRSSSISLLVTFLVSFLFSLIFFSLTSSLLQLLPGFQTFNNKVTVTLFSGYLHLCCCFHANMLVHATHATVVHSVDIVGRDYLNVSSSANRSFQMVAKLACRGFRSVVSAAATAAMLDTSAVCPAESCTETPLGQQRSTLNPISDAFSRGHDPITHARRA